MIQSGVRAHFRFVFLGILAAACAGCFGLSQENKRPWSAAADSSVASETHRPEVQPAAVKASAPAQAETSQDKTVSHKTENKPARIGLPEDEKAKSLAVDLAKANPDVKKIKVCHDKKNDEWWLVLYEDAGDYFRLRQYTWSIEQDQPEEFLVLRRISKSKLESHLSATEVDRVCKVVEYEPGGRQLAVSSGGSPPQDPRRKEVFAQHRRSPVPDPERTLARKPAVAEKIQQAPEATPSVIPPKGIAQPQTNMIPSRVQVVSKPPASEVAARKAAAPPETGVFVQAAARNSPAEIDPLKEGTFLRNANAGVSLEKSSPPRAKITSDTGVFALAAVRIAPEPANPPQGGRQRSRTGDSEYSSVDQGIKSRFPDTPAPLTGREKASKLVSTERTIGRGRDIPTSFVFVYGSEMNHQELLGWLRANHYDSSVILDATPATLDEYDLVWNYYSPSRGGGTVNLEPKKNSGVWGLLVEVEDRGLKAFDQRAGHPAFYARGENRVSVRRVTDGRTLFAWLYRAKANRSGRRDVWPTSEYKKKIVEAANFWQFPRQYVERLESLPTR